MHVEPGVSCKPCLDRRGLVRAVVVHHQMHIQLGWHSLQWYAGTAKLPCCDGACVTVQSPPRGNVQCRKQRRRSMAHVVVRSALRNTWCQRQDRLCAVQRLYLALLIHAQHHRLDGRVHVQADDVTDFVDKNGSLESLNVSWRCGCRPKARQIRLTAVCDMPIAWAMVRVLQ